MSFTLYRYLDTGIQTLGHLFYNDRYVCDTLERPWMGNQRKISCIPIGKYLVRPTISPHNGNCVEVMEVPDRSHIQIHSANKVTELEGCIAVGIKSAEMVLHSKENLAMVLRLLGDKISTLEVKAL